MVIGIIGENCSGKSTLANEIQRTIGAEVITGKDYLRMSVKINDIFKRMDEIQERLEHERRQRKKLENRIEKQ